jgi:hypothetical protein
MTAWKVAGSYFEVCNCHAPCLNLEVQVSYGIPRHDHPGQEVVASHMRVTDPPLGWIVDGRCGFATAFDYRSD